MEKKGIAVYWVYELEVTAVEDDLLYVLVTLKGTRDEEGRWLKKNDVVRGDIELQLRDGDCVSTILGMAVAVKGLGERCETLPEPDGLRECYREWHARAEQWQAAHSAMRM